MNWAGEAVSAYGRFISPEEVIAAIEQIRVEQVQSIARYVFRSARASLAVVGPGLAEGQESMFEEWIQCGIA